MGIHNRDYIREERPGGGWGGHSDNWAIKYLLIANIAVFLLQNVDRRVEDLLALQFGYRTMGEAVRAYDSPERRLETATIPANTRVAIVQRQDRLIEVAWPIDERTARRGWIPIDAVHFDMSTALQVWRLITYGFCHSRETLWHILFNMYFLWMFGRLIEPIYGSREFLSFYLIAIMLSGLASVAAYALRPIGGGGIPLTVTMLGASGGVMAVVIVTAMHYPRLKVLLMFIIPVEFRWLAVFYVVADLMGFMSGGTGIAHEAHLAGAAFGLGYKYFDWRILSFVRRGFGNFGLPGPSRPRSARGRVRLYQPPDRKLDEQVDAILDKIHKSGEASLTEQERETLKQASERYKNR